MNALSIFIFFTLHIAADKFVKSFDFILNYFILLLELASIIVSVLVLIDMNREKSNENIEMPLNNTELIVAAPSLNN